MSTRERKNETTQREAQTRPQRSTPPAGDPSGQIESVQQRAEQLLSAADDVIARALSGDAEAFLKATRQQGGE